MVCGLLVVVVAVEPHLVLSAVVHVVRQHVQGSVPVSRLGLAHHAVGVEALLLVAAVGGRGAAVSGCYLVKLKRSPAAWFFEPPEGWWATKGLPSRFISAWEPLGGWL